MIKLNGIIVLFLFSVIGFAQQGFVDYKVSVIKSFDDKEVEADYPEIFEAFKNIESVINNNLLFTLSFKDNESVFENKKSVYAGDAKFLEEALSKTIGRNAIYYNDIVNNIYVKQQEYWGTDVLIEDDLENFNWEITPESKQVGKYKCYKAIGKDYVVSNGKEFKDEVIAWFTPEIPIKSGPLNFGGLPGLILKLNFNNHIYYADKIKFLNNDESIAVIRPSKGKKMSLTEFYKKEIELVKIGRKAIREGKLYNY
ncbi:MAG: GLPGLI family protein [Flavobacteriaceae bacterium]